MRLLSPVNASGLREERALLERSLRRDQWSEKENFINLLLECFMVTYSEVSLGIGENTPSGRSPMPLPLKSLD